MGLERVLRRLAPTVVRWTYNPVFKACVNSFDLLPRLAYKELAGIPPNHLRIRIGVGNRIFANQLGFLTWQTDFWLHAFHSGLCRLDSTIVDIGCGCGRYAHYLRDYGFKSERFSGRYFGIDVDEEMLAWCRQHYDHDRFSFHRSTHISETYSRPGLPSHRGNRHVYYSLPLGDGTADFVFSTSLFTHLLEDELVNYCKESHRVLRREGYMLMTFFSINRPPPTFGERHTFKHEVGNAYFESTNSPEAAVAYNESFLLKVAQEAGFRTVEIQAAVGGWQPALLCRK